MFNNNTYNDKSKISIKIISDKHLLRETRQSPKVGLTQNTLIALLKKDKLHSP